MNATAGGGGMAGASGSGPYVVPQVDWPSAECTAKANEILGKMSNTEKAAQMVMGLSGNDTMAGDVSGGSSIGTVFAGGSTAAGASTASEWAAYIDPYIQAGNASKYQIPIFFGIDAVHGASKTSGSVLFPQNAGLGSTRDPQLVEDIGRATAIEAAASGMSWTYAPSLSVAFDDRWGRVFESFSEDPELAGLLGAASVLGLQGRGGLGSTKPSIIACGKHFAGDGQATFGTGKKSQMGQEGGIDRGDVKLNDADMDKYGIAPYLLSIKAGIGTIMVSDATWNDANMTSNKKLVTDILKTKLGFKGVVATDWNASDGYNTGGAIATVNAGVDVLMQPTDWKKKATEIANAVPGQISQDRLDDAVRRILTVKCQAGLFGATRDTTLMSKVGSAEHRALGRKAVAASLVLLKNEKNALPLKKQGKFFVTGYAADNLERQSGGWSVMWQGFSGKTTTGTTIRAAIGKNGTLVNSADEADAVVVVLSERTYAEFFGDSASIDTLSKDDSSKKDLGSDAGNASGDWAALSAARASGKPVIAIILSGRPVLINSHLGDADAWIAAWLPGTEGDGVADVLFGDYKPTGKLSHSWPKTAEQVMSNYGQAGYDGTAMQFPFGHGLSY
jgi:beta-glucosidase